MELKARRSFDCTYVCYNVRSMTMTAWDVEGVAQVDGLSCAWSADRVGVVWRRESGTSVDSWSSATLDRTGFATTGACGLTDSDFLPDLRLSWSGSGVDHADKRLWYGGDATWTSVRIDYTGYWLDYELVIEGSFVIPTLSQQSAWTDLE